MKKIILMLSLLGIVYGVHAQTPAPAADPAANKNGPKFQFKEETHDFKNIPEGPVAEYVFKFKNVGKEPLIIQNASGSCGCTKPEWPSEPVKPGKSGKLTVRYNTQGRVGPFTKDVYIVSNAVDGQPRYTIHIKGTVDAAPPKPEVKKEEPAK